MMLYDEHLRFKSESETVREWEIESESEIGGVQGSRWDEIERVRDIEN